MESNALNDNDQMEDSNNEEEQLNIITDDDNLNKDINNQEIKSNKSKESEEKQEISDNNEKIKNIEDTPPKEKRNKRKIFEKIKTQNIQKKKKNLNPFLTENNIENNRLKKNSKIENTKNVKISYLNNFKSDKTDISDLKDSSINKTVFSKIVEIMYKNTKEEIFPSKNAKNLELECVENYNKLTGEAFLCSCANKANKENQKIINGFLGRKKNEEISKKIGLDADKEKEGEIESLQDIKRITVLTDRNRSYISSRTFQEFLQDQKNKEEEHQNHLKKNINLKKVELKSNIKDKPTLSEETLKIAKNINRNINMNIHSRLYHEYNEKRKREENKEKLKNIMYNRVEEKKLPKAKIKENVERLFHEYEEKKKRLDENELKKNIELRKISSNHTNTSKNSNEIIFKRFKKNLENSLDNIIGKKIDDNFEISYLDFVKLLYKIKFTTKDYFELIENKDKIKDKKEEKIKLNVNIKGNRIIYKKTNYEYDKEYKLIIDAWKIITKNKEFKNDILGSSKRLLLFFLSVLGIYQGNIEDSFIQKEFSFMIKDLKNINGSSINYSNLSKQIYKYFNLYRNNAINGLLFRDKEKKRRLELENEIEKYLPFTPNLEKSSNFLSNHHSVTEKRLSVNYDQYRKNKELKIKEKEKILEKEEKEKCPFFPGGAPKITDKKNIIEISKRLYNARLKHLKNSNSTPNNFENEEKNKQNLGRKIFNSNNNSIQKMFNNNPLEKDLRVKKKIKELKESRNKKSFQKLVLKKGYKPKEDFKNNDDLIDYNELGYKNERFVHDDEPLNNFKNTFQKYERLEQKKGKREKYIFEIVVDNKPRNLIIYQDEDINYKVKVFCNVYKLTYDDKKRILQTILQQLKGKNNFYY